MTEPAPPPSEGDPAGKAVRSPDAADPGASQWARPGGPADEGPSLAPETAAVAYAPPPVPPTGPPPPPGAGWAPTPPANPTWGAAPSAGPGWGAPPTSGPGWGPPPTPGSGWGAPPASGSGWGAPPAPGPGWNTLPPPPREPARPPKRVDHLPGTPFGVVHLDVPPVTAGLAVGSLVAGVASIVVSLVVACFGIGGESVGGAWAAGAFTLPGVLAGAGAIVAGWLGLRQIRRPVPPPGVRFTGRGLALAGISCGVAGLMLSLVALGLALLLQFT